MKTSNKGLIAVIISAVIFGSMPLLAKIIYANGGNALSLIFYRFFLSLPVLFIIIKRNKKIDLKVTKEELKKLSIVSLFGYSATAILLFMSYNYVSTGIATTIHFVYPIFVVIGSIFFYKDKANFIKILCVFLCAIGVVFFSKDLRNNNLLGIIISFISGITYAFYILYIDKSNLKKMYPFKLTFYLCLISSIIVFTYCISTRTFTLNLTLIGWIAAIILSISTSVGAVTLFQLGIKIVGSQNAAIFSTFEPITSVVIGIIAFNEKFNISTFIGSILILSAVIITALNENKSSVKE